METHYQSFEAAVQLVPCQGQGAYIVKGDFKSAFRNVPMWYEDLDLLGIKIQGKIFIDCSLLFSAAVLCEVFKDVSTLDYREKSWP